MNNNQKDSLEYQEAKLFQYSDNTVIDVLTEKEEGESSSKFVLIKHDYYSSDSDYGRKVLSVFISCLCDSQYSNLNIFILDSGTLILNDNHPLYSKINQLIAKAKTVVVDNESIEINSICHINSKVEIRPIESIVEDLVYLRNVLVLE